MKLSATTKHLILVILMLACRPSGYDTNENNDSSTSGETLSSEGSTSETEVGTETGDLPMPTPDVMDPTSCEPFGQACPEGEKCVPYAHDGMSWNDTKCVPVLGDEMPGEPCTYDGPSESTDNCDATSFCWDVDRQGTGTCRPFCMGAPDDPVCPRGSSCLIAWELGLAICVIDRGRAS